MVTISFSVTMMMIASPVEMAMTLLMAELAEMLLSSSSTSQHIPFRFRAVN
ncbi:hypothetical protein [Rhizobium leguminosarum]|uniref:hypothetical protein n=1 Tax=Rhizobium leguminosarum TaxID=384 RepID=UPI001FEF8A8E|nr:hypothetical protein [Rhizobium leguminosarum]